MIKWFASMFVPNTDFVFSIGGGGGGEDGGGGGGGEDGGGGGGGEDGGEDGGGEDGGGGGEDGGGEICKGVASTFFCCMACNTAAWSRTIAKAAALVASRAARWLFRVFLWIPMIF